jgi:hypothetical protein
MGAVAFIMAEKINVPWPRRLAGNMTMRNPNDRN